MTTIWIQKLLLTIDSTDRQESIITIRVLTIKNCYYWSVIVDTISDE